jgi:hypothetical protein
MHHVPFPSPLLLLSLTQALLLPLLLLLQVAAS